MNKARLKYNRHGISIPSRVEEKLQIVLAMPEYKFETMSGLISKAMEQYFDEILKKELDEVLNDF